MAFPSPTKQWHTERYSAIDETRPELSATGKSIVITGGGSGIGPEIVASFAKAGATKLAILGRTERTLKETKKSIEGTYKDAQVYTFITDVSDEDSVAKAARDIRSQLGPWDVLVANAGYLSEPSPILDSDLKEWWKSVEINVKGHLLLTRYFVPDAAKEGAAFISMNTGGAHFAPFSGLSAYATSKAATAKLMEYVQAENEHIRVVSVHPGVIKSDMNVKSKVTLPADDISLPASFIVWASSPEASFLKGKFVWASWDVDELKERAKEIQEGPLFTMTLGGWPFA